VKIKDKGEGKEIGVQEKWGEHTKKQSHKEGNRCFEI
jgi:hypothetical protein